MESAVCWSRPLLHPDTAGLDSTPSAEWMDGIRCLSSIQISSQSCRLVFLSDLSVSSLLHSSSLHTSCFPHGRPTALDVKPSAAAIVTQWPRRPRVTAKFSLWPPKCKAHNRTCSFSDCCHDSSGRNGARPGFWPKTEQNKRKGPLFWSQLEIWAKAKSMTGRSLRRRCLHPVGRIESMWGASPVAVLLSVCHGFCHCWRYTRDEASQPHFSQQNIIFFP